MKRFFAVLALVLVIIGGLVWLRSGAKKKDPHAEAQMPIQFIVHSMPQARVKLAIDGAVLFDGLAKQEIGNAWLTTTVPTTLATGWHRVQLRTFDWGYGTEKVGLAIDAPLEALWGIRCTGHQPE